MQMRRWPQHFPEGALRPLLAVGGQRHGGVHGEDLALHHAALAAGCERQQHPETEENAEELFMEKEMVFHSTTVVG